MIIERIKVEHLNPADYNPRKDLNPDDAEYKKLKKSIKEFDYIEPIIWNRQTGRIVGGHQRLKVLMDLGHTEIDVSVVDMNEEKEKALNIALNKISGEWDFPKLSDLLTELDDGIFDIELTGFDAEEIENILNPDAGEKEKESKDLSDRFIGYYQVLVDCQNEEEQEKAFNLLQGEGFECRILTL